MIFSDLSGKQKQRSAPATPDSDSDSLDFTHVGRDKSPAPRAHAKRDKADRSRRVAVPVLIIIAIGLAVAFAMTERSSKEVATPRPSAQPTSPTYQSAPASKPPQTYTPSPKLRAPPPPAPTPETVQTRKIPAEFLKAFEAYATQSGGKAIALALDNEGRWAYGSISGYAAQSDANDEALSECARFKTQAGVQANCRLYAVGDKVIW